MTFLQAAILGVSIVWGFIFVSHLENADERQQRTENNAKANHERSMTHEEY